MIQEKKKKKIPFQTAQFSLPTLRNNGNLREKKKKVK